MSLSNEEMCNFKGPQNQPLQADENDVKELADKQIKNDECEKKEEFAEKKSEELRKVGYWRIKPVLDSSKKDDAGELRQAGYWRTTSDYLGLDLEHHEMKVNCSNKWGKLLLKDFCDTYNCTYKISKDHFIVDKDQYLKNIHQKFEYYEPLLQLKIKEEEEMAALWRTEYYDHIYNNPHFYEYDKLGQINEDFKNNCKYAYKEFVRSVELTEEDRFAQN
jgi:hypothetical protein